jgi:hypothetical protein
MEWISCLTGMIKLAFKYSYLPYIDVMSGITFVPTVWKFQMLFMDIGYVCTHKRTPNCTPVNFAEDVRCMTNELRCRFINTTMG